MLNDQQKLLEANPDLYAKLYNIKQRSATHDDPRKDPQTMIAADKKGSPAWRLLWLMHAFRPVLSSATAR